MRMNEKFYGQTIINLRSR